MNESQHVEWKESWRDEYLRWICGFANAEGGVLVIGRNDKGVAVGVPQVKKLLEDIPNKVRDILGIMVEVNLRREAGHHLLEIVTPPYPSPISYRSHYYQRVGSTNQELRGASLDRFLLRKQGRTWDGVPVPGVAVKELATAAIKRFRTLARASGRVEPGILRESVAGLIEKLKLRDGTYLKRAAVLLFHEDPERFVSGAFVKIGFFRSESDLVYHDEVRGDLFTQVANTIDLLQTKYLKAVIRYEGLQRIERFPVPDAALREAVLNALIHRDYAVAAPVQIRVYANRLRIWNPAVLPEGWSLDDLLREHASLPYNPNVANAFFRAGEIEAWGRGIQRIFQACRDAKSLLPQFELTGHDLWTGFPYAPDYVQALASAVPSEGDAGAMPVKTPVETPVKTPVKIIEILAQNPNLTLAEVARTIGKSKSAVERASRKLVLAGRLRYVGPAKGGHWEVTP